MSSDALSRKLSQCQTGSDQNNFDPLHGMNPLERQDASSGDEMLVPGHCGVIDGV